MGSRVAPGPPGAFLPWPRRSQRGFWGGSGFRVGGGGGEGVLRPLALGTHGVGQTDVLGLIGLFRDLLVS